MLMFRRVVGHSMMPGFPPGDLVIGRKHFSYKKLRPGKVVILQHDGKEKIKRIDRVNGKRLFVLGDNPDGSSDSRQFGWIERDEVLAVVVWPRR